jgi:ankyrin repeat protein
MASEEQLAKAESIRDHAAKGNLPDIKKMVQENLEDVIWWINEGNTRGNTALQLAAMWGHVDCCQELLAAGADKDKQSNVREHAPGAPPVFPLTAAQPPPMNRSAPNRAPGRAASSFRDSLAHHPVCRLGRAQIGHTPLMCAAIKGGRAAVVRELIKLGANVNKQDNVSRLSIICGPPLGLARL